MVHGEGGKGVERMGAHDHMVAYLYMEEAIEVDFSAYGVLLSLSSVVQEAGEGEEGCAAGVFQGVVDLAGTRDNQQEDAS